MAEIFHFTPQHEIDARKNVSDFIRMCRHNLTVFGADLDWNANHWPIAGITFANLDQTTRTLDPKNIMRQPFLDFAKAYFRYIQGHSPTKHKVETRALKCIERALAEQDRCDLLEIDSGTLDRAAVLAREHYALGSAYHAGREIERLAYFVSDRRLISTQLDWKNPIARPTDTVRTGKEARQAREKKLPDDETLRMLADIFAKNPQEPRDIFTTSICAMLLCAPSRVSEVLALPVDCEIRQAKRDGSQAYGWRFQPGKGAPPMIKWIPDAMVSLAEEAIRRIRNMTDEARRVAAWLEDHPNKFYRHPACPDAADDQPLSIREAAAALGIGGDHPNYWRAELVRRRLPDRDGMNSFATLNQWIRKRLPSDFPWFDKERNLKFRDALFCLQERQLRTDMAASPYMVWKPTNNIVNNDLGERETSNDYVSLSIFSRHGYLRRDGQPFKVTSHQFRHLLNTMAQRGGLSQAEIARWSGRIDLKQNRVYDHMTEYELVDMLRSHDVALTLDRPLEEIAEKIAAVIPMTRQEFNTLTIPTAHVTEFGFCVHDFVMTPCQRFRDCLNCTEQVCIKGDRRLERVRARYAQVKALKDRAEGEIAAGSAGADRWYEIHALTEKRLAALIAILESPEIKPGTIIRLHNDEEFSPLRRAIDAKVKKSLASPVDHPQIEDLRRLMGGEHG